MPGLGIGNAPSESCVNLSCSYDIRYVRVGSNQHSADGQGSKISSIGFFVLTLLFGIELPRGTWTRQVGGPSIHQWSP